MTESTKSTFSIGARIEELKTLAHDEVLRQKDVIVQQGTIWRPGRGEFGGQAVWYAPPGVQEFLNGKVKVDGVWEEATLVNTF